MPLKNIIEVILKSSIAKTDKNALLTKYSEVQNFLNLKSQRKYEYFYLNKEHIHQILYDEEKIIKIQSNTPEKNLHNLFYIILLIKHQPYLTNYIYEYNYIENVNNFRKNSNNELSNFLLSRIIMELIDNYKGADEFYNYIHEKRINEIYEENKKVMNISLLTRFNFNLIKKEVESNALEEIYSFIIISLIKEEQFENDFEKTEKIFEQMDLQEINITEKIYGKLLPLFTGVNNNSYLQKYSINSINDIYKEANINFYFIMFKFIFKNPMDIYDIPFFNKSRNALLKIIKLKSDKLAENSINLDIKFRIKIDFVIQAFCNSNYYFSKYLGVKFVQLKYILKYYNNYLFYTKKSEVKELENLFNEIKVEIDYEKILQDKENAEKFNLIYPIIKCMNEENKNEKNEEIKENNIRLCVRKWEEIANNIKIQKIKKEDKIFLKKCFSREENKDLLIQIFNKDIYEYTIKEINNEEYKKIVKDKNIINENDNSNYQKTSETEIKIEEIEIADKSIEDNRNNEINKFLPIITDNTINQDNQTKNNITDKNASKSKATIIYDSEIQKNEIIFDENESFLLTYLSTIGKHEKFAEFVTEISNGFLMSGGDESLFIYNQEYKKIKSIENMDWVTNVSEITEEVGKRNTQESPKLIALSKQELSLLRFDPDEIITTVFRVYNFDLYATNKCLNVQDYFSIFCTDYGIYYADNLFSKIAMKRINKIKNGAYRGGIIIDDKIAAFTSNKSLKGGEDVIEFFNYISKKSINKIKGFSFVTSPNGLSLMTTPENSSKSKVLLCACKKYNSHQKNGILLVNTKIERRQPIKKKFYNTGNYEVYCFCPIMRRTDGPESIFNYNKNFIETNYFLVGGYEKKKGKGILKLYKLIKNEDDEDIGIEFIQDIQFKKGKEFKGFNEPISCITQSKRNGKIIISSWDGNICLFSCPRIETFIKYEQRTKFDCMLLTVEKEKKEIVVDIF